MMKMTCQISTHRSINSVTKVNINGLMQPLTMANLVEINETKYFHRKYHRQQWQEGHWVFGGIERETGKCFLMEVPDCTAATLQQHTENHILPGRHTVSDGWAACANTEVIRGEIHISSSAVSMWYSYILIDIDRYFTKYLDIDIDRYRCTCHSL